MIIDPFLSDHIFSKLTIQIVILLHDDFFYSVYNITKLLNQTSHINPLKIYLYILNEHMMNIQNIMVPHLLFFISKIHILYALT